MTAASELAPPPSAAAEPRAFDAIVLALGEPAHRGKVCGLTLAERGRRLAGKAGAARVVVVDSVARAADLGAWIDRDRDVLILRASDQVVHFPLIDAVRGRGVAVAVTPDGGYAGAIWIPAGAGLCEGAPRGDLDAALSALTKLDGDVELARHWRETGRASEHVHGDIARHRAVTRDERRAATKMLFQLVHKPDQDGFLSKYLFRPVAYPITRALLPTPITPNGVTFIVMVLALGGCVLVAGASYEAALVGSLLQHVAGYFDCTDGEIARLRHEGSKLGQWFDTLVDEATTVAYLLCVGIHVYKIHAGDWYQPYIAYTIPLGVAGACTGIFVIYYYLVKVARSGNSQDYPVKKGGKLEPLAQLTHRDFIGLGSFILAIFNLTEISYLGMGLGGLVSGLLLLPEHVRLRRDLASGRVVPKPKLA